MLVLLFLVSMSFADDEQPPVVTYPPVGLYQVLLQTKDPDDRWVNPMTYVLASSPEDAIVKAEATGRGTSIANWVELLSPRPEVDVFLDLPKGCYE